MITVNTNISSLFCQKSLNTATNGLNKALERMSTGLRINSSKDDAAGMAISTNFDIKSSSYTVANRNTQDGLSYIQTATGTLDLMSKQLQRMRDLAEQAANGTYGETERKAMQTEANALADELLRVKNSTEYNGKKIFGKHGETTTSTTQAVGYKQIKPKTDAELDAEYGVGNYVTVSTAEQLNTELTVNGCSKTIVLTDDIDLDDLPTTAEGNWIARGTKKAAFTGTFDGNGYTISNLTINKPKDNYQGLFGYTDGATIRNVKLKGVDIIAGTQTSGLVGCASGGEINNCFVSGKVTGNNQTGGLVGQSASTTISNCSSSGSVTGTSQTGGLIGYNSGTVSNCSSSGSVTGTSQTGGLIGYNSGTVSNCTSSGTVEGKEYIGGLIGTVNNATISNCSSSTNVTGTHRIIGGLVGLNYYAAKITDCYSTGTVDGGASNIGGLVGINGSGGPPTAGYITNSYSVGKTTSKTVSAGGLAGGNTILHGAKVEESFYDKETSGKSDDSGKGTPLTTAEMKTAQTFKDAGWDENIWYFEDGEYPKLQSFMIPNSINLQVGINNDENSVINVETGLNINSFKVDISSESAARNALDTIDNMIATVTKKNTQLGATANRLLSVFDVNDAMKTSFINTSSLIKDADMAVESSNYIKSQILQSATATLLSTANQAPNIALSLI